MKRLVVLGLLWGFSCFAEEPVLSDLPVFSERLDKAGIETLHSDIGVRMAAIESMRAGFSQKKKIEALRRPLKSRGTFLYLAGEGVVWDFEHPFPTRYVLTPTSMTRKADGVPDERMTAKDQPKIKRFAGIFSAMFTGNTDALAENFHLHAEQSETGWRIGLIPRNPVMRQIISHVVLDGTDTVQRVRILEKNGDFTDLHFEDIKTDGPVSDDEREQFKS